MAILKPKRWIDGIALQAACEVLRVRVCVIRYNYKVGEWQAAGHFEPRKPKAQGAARSTDPIAMVLRDGHYRS
eukprot:12930322-Alexandrium_andersonii.AAC.1